MTRLILREEAVWGELDLGNTGYGLEFTRETMDSPYDSVDHQHRISSRGAVEPLLTNSNVQGEIRGELQPHGAWPRLFKHALGTVVEGGSYPYVHTIKGGNTLPTGLTISKLYQMRDNDSGIRTDFMGCKVNQLILDVRRQSPIVARVMVQGQRMLSSTYSSYTADWPTDNGPFTDRHTTIRIDESPADPDVSAVCTAASLNIDNDLRSDWGPAGTTWGSARDRISLVPGLRRISGSLSAFFCYTPGAMWLGWWRNNTDLQLRIRCRRESWIYDIYLPKIKFRGNVPPITGRGPINITMPFVAYVDESLGTDIIVTITNADPTL